jgi:hypothetical protein
METATQQSATAKRNRGPGRPFQPGNDPRRDNSGRKRITPEQRERERLALRAADRVVSDVMAELRSMTGPAVDRLRKLIDDPDPAVALRACTDIISRVNGLPVATNIVATMGGTDPVKRLTAEDVAAAAKAYLAKQALTIEMSP